VLSLAEIIQGRIVKCLSEYEIVINKGKSNGVNEGQTFLVYLLDDEMFDPESHESLGRLEIVCGKGRIIHVQEKMATLESCTFEASEQRTIKKHKRQQPFSYFGEYDQEEEIIPNKVRQAYLNMESLVERGHVKLISN